MGGSFHAEAGDPGLRVPLVGDLVLDPFSGVIKIATEAIIVVSAEGDPTFGSRTLGLGTANAAPSSGGLIKDHQQEWVPQVWFM